MEWNGGTQRVKTTTKKRVGNRYRIYFNFCNLKNLNIIKKLINILQRV